MIGGDNVGRGSVVVIGPQKSLISNGFGSAKYYDAQIVFLH